MVWLEDEPQLDVLKCRFHSWKMMLVLFFLLVSTCGYGHHA